MQTYDEKKDIKRLVDQIEEIRRKHDLNRFELLDMADMSPNVLDHWVNRGTDPKVGSMSRVLQVMGYELEIKRKNHDNDD